jgi:hypothetical protein
MYWGIKMRLYCMTTALSINHVLVHMHCTLLLQCPTTSAQSAPTMEFSAGLAMAWNSTTSTPESSTGCPEGSEGSLILVGHGGPKGPLISTGTKRPGSPLASAGPGGAGSPLASAVPGGAGSPLTSAVPGGAGSPLASAGPGGAGEGSLSLHTQYEGSHAVTTHPV